MSSTWTFNQYPATRDLDGIVQVDVSISGSTAVRRAFNKLLILGSTDIIPAYSGSGTLRVREYASLADMLTDGFTSSDPEYEAAAVAFASDPAPTSIYVGRQDLTSLNTVALNGAGTGYHVGDVLTLTQSGASGGKVTVKTIVAETGAIATLETDITAPGTGYAVGTALATTVTPSGGSGATIDVSVVGESIATALLACRVANFEWYIGIAPEAAQADHLACAAEVETWGAGAGAYLPTTIYAFTTDDADALTAVEGSIFVALKDLNYARTIGQYSTKSDYAIVAIMAYAMAANNKAANSSFTLKFKQEIGVSPETLTTAQISNIENNNGNVLLSYGNYYEFFEQGKMANGQFFDEVLGLDMLVNDIQTAVMDLLYDTAKVPQTDAGVTQIINEINTACALSVTRGFLAPGVWNGVAVLNLSKGDTLSAGYLVQAGSVADQSQADREARVCPTIYVAAKEAGAIHSVIIELSVNR